MHVVLLKKKLFGLFREDDTLRHTLFKVLYFQEKKFFSGNQYKSKGERVYGSGGEKTGLLSDFSSISSVMR